jgi:hypothetical protein
MLYLMARRADEFTSELVGVGVGVLDEGAAAEEFVAGRHGDARIVSLETLESVGHKRRRGLGAAVPPG